ncbi:MAG: bifunctional adenosylcobinamide kinase/adenosylcobinamide-phosphate guanylyltransferase [Hespellia sp.]|nr:bifunctional adenosylcobinamide kinase/adenosylcobinamide-phosphate guanylyltransferase [Hespellia sp.]
MRLIIGGSYQGKLEFATKLFPKLRWIDGAVCPLDAVESCEGIYHFHEYVKRWIQSGKDNENIAETMAAQLHERNPDIVIVSDEIGYGLVPVDAFERNYRETTGRICTELAGYACEVYRVICGIGILIKEGRTNEDGTGTGIAGRD